MAGLYLHIPFCLSKCSYCDFYSTINNESLLASYPDLLLTDLDLACRRGWQGPIHTIYFGGGTPSLLKPEAIAKILHAVDTQLGIASKAEISLEANPGTISPNSLVGYRAAGINRLSLGLQTLDPKQLERIGRRHSRQEGLDAVHWARQTGFDNLSLDLMFALPSQRADNLQTEITAFLDLAPEHLSCYGLTAETGTPLAAKVATGSITLADEDLYAEAFLMIHEQLTSAGYEHYEIANYAKDGFACHHNLGYWRRQPYLGLGAGAHSFRDEGWGQRWAVANNLKDYSRRLAAYRNPAECLETFDRATALSETVYLALRTREGVSDEMLKNRFGCTLAESYPVAVNRLIGWLEKRAGHWSLTPQGWLLYDHLIQAFL